jgi:peptidoglycan/LPS O-acetylase OafA/YrhL
VTRGERQSEYLDAWQGGSAVALVGDGAPPSDHQVKAPSIIPAVGYRSEIDGLRALAVLPVILFHAGFRAFGGGFIGVDIFFVISGYLITGIIWNDLEKKRFSLRRFYERRVRRILPALFLVLAVCVPLGWFTLPPNQTTDLAKSALATLVFVSNFYFFSQANYFAPNADVLPLQHTWSLAVEEQFYVFFPLLLMALYRAHSVRRITAFIVMLGIASFALCEWVHRWAPEANFYLAPFRVWELMAGSICALAERQVRISGNSLFGATGLLLIFLGFAVINKSTPFPSDVTLLPVLGAVLVIVYARVGTLPGRFLSSSPFVGLGLMSYSAYLWHKPLFAFANAYSIEPIGTANTLALIALALVLAWATWQFVERPFRSGFRTEKGRGQLRWIAAAPIVLGCAYGLASVTGGFAGRFDQRKLLAFEAERKLAPEAVSCKVDYKPVEPLACRLGTVSTATARIAVIGDSHASQLFPALQRIAEQRNWEIDLYSKSSCPIIDRPIGYVAWGREYYECETWRERLWQRLASKHYDLILVSHSTMSYARFNGRFNLSTSEWEQGFSDAARRLTKSGRSWAVLADNPQFRNIDPVACAFRSNLVGNVATSRCEITRAQAFAVAATAAEQRVAKRFGGGFIDLNSRFCDNAHCTPIPNGRLVMSDSNHFSASGTLLLVDPLEKAISERLHAANDSSAAPRTMISPPTAS